MLGQPASSQTVCSPSRRTSDFSSVYSGPVRSRVLIQSGLRSIGTWLLRTSRRSILRPAGSTRDPADALVSAVSLLISTVLPVGTRPGHTGAPLIPPRALPAPDARRPPGTRPGRLRSAGPRSGGRLRLTLRGAGDLVDPRVDGVG